MRNSVLAQRGMLLPVVVLSLAITACGDSGDVGAEPPVVAVDASGDCEYTGPDSAAPGMLSVDFENRHSEDRFFAVLVLSAGRDIDDLVGITIHPDGQWSHYHGPRVADSVKDLYVAVDDGSSMEASADLGPGTHVFLCARSDVEDATVAGAIEIDG